MDKGTKFESRVGKLTCNSEEVYDFVTDLRNFERFLPHDVVTDWHAEKNSCNFSVHPLGNVNLRLTEKEPSRKVIFSGEALQTNSFSLFLQISGTDSKPAEVRITLNAELNPILKIMAAKPVTIFLEALITEMERFRGWHDIKA